MPFNFGWGDHFPWNNGDIFWHFSDNRKNRIRPTGTQIVVCLYFSVTEQTQSVFKNGVNILTGPEQVEPKSVVYFLFPIHSGNQTTQLVR